ncbi:MAG TPA: hypothetical protein VFA24_01815 [Gaiellaceae bacterium]|nr:hypothetical protein [Gaiellaceae bacterium]
MLRRLERYAPLMGVLAVVLWVVGAILLFDGAPGDKASGAEIATWFDHKSSRILVAMLLFGLGTSAFIWFLASVAARLREAEGHPRLPSIVLVAGAAAAAVFTLSPATSAAGALAYDNLERTLTPQAAEALWVLPDGFFFASEMIAVAFMGAAAVSILRTRIFPVWYGAVTGLVAIVLIIAPIGWAALLFGIPIWTLVTSVWLFARQPRETVAVPA